MAVSPLARKLQIKPDTRIQGSGVPEDVAGGRDPLPDGAAILKRAGKSEIDGLLLFASTKKELDNTLDTHFARLTHDGLLWVAFPKKSSGIQTDLSMYEGWSKLEDAGLRGIRMISIDDTWSALRWRPNECVKS
ncbi:MAG: hypothetical protein ACYTGL_06170 [Planctomycetota bacterium]